MSDKKIKRNIYSGVKVTDSISFTIPKKRFLPDFLPLTLIALCGVIGIFYSFITMFHIKINNDIIAVYITLFFALFSIIFILPKKFIFTIIPILIIYEILLYRNWNNYIKGFMLIYNQVYNIIWPKRSEYFNIELSGISKENTISIIMSFTIFLIIMLICYFTIVKPNFFFGFLITFPFIEIGLYYGKTPALLPAFMVIIYWTVLLSVHQSGYYRNLGRSKTGFIRKGNHFIVKPLIKYRTAGQSGIILMTGCALIIGLIFIIINLTGYSRSDRLNIVRDNLKTALSEFTFNDVKGSIERISDSFELGNIKIYSHRLGNLHSISYNNTTDLIVTCDEAFNPNGNIYLKGYVGSIYDGKSWNELNSQIYDNSSGLFDNSNLHPQDFLYNSLNENSSLNYTLNIEICFRNAKYNYTPYNSVPKGEIKYINDTVIELENKKNYSFNISEKQNFNSLMKQEQYGNNSEYEEFVYSNYLKVPDNDEIKKLYNNFIKDNISDNVYTQLSYIRTLLSDNAEYTLEPGKTPADRDFVNYFLTENHKGYCVHFATSGIILARMSGIPARYAEGYVMTEDDLKDENLTQNGYKVEIKDNRAHAWAEVYLKEYGWVPFEFTPPSAAAFTNIQTSETKETTSTHQNITKNSENISLSSNTKNADEITDTTIKTKTEKSVNSNTDFSHPSDNNQYPIGLKLIIAAIFSVILIISIIAAIHLIVLKKRSNSFKTDNYSENAINAYEYILKLINFCGIKNDNMQHLEFAEYVEKELKGTFKSNEFIDVTKIALEAKLSNKIISRDKSEAIIRLALKISDIIYKRQNLIVRIFMKYFKNLC